MTLHMIPDFDRGFMRGLTNVVLILHPVRVVASYAMIRESPMLADIGFVQQAELFDQVANRLGNAPLVIVSDVVLADPARALTDLCDGLGIAYDSRMLKWPIDPKDFDGIWAPHWFGAVHASSGFDEPEEMLPRLSGVSAKLADRAIHHYQTLAKHTIAFPKPEITDANITP